MSQGVTVTQASTNYNQQHSALQTAVKGSSADSHCRVNLFWLHKAGTSKQTSEGKSTRLVPGCAHHRPDPE